MDKPPDVTTLVNDFKGQYSDIDPMDNPQGTMQLQLNMLCITQGELTTRGGLKEVTLDALE